MTKKSLLLLSFACMPLALSFAKRQIDNQDLGPQNSWQEEFDIESKKTGKYNILVTAEDQAGNEYKKGPYNIYIDPESDLPVTRITNPVEGMFVPGNLNIVGACVDDDLGRMSKADKALYPEVYLIFDGDEENPQKASGTEFWSYYLDTTQLSEGPHTIEVYGVEYTDKEGKVNKEVPKTGHKAKVTWQLNRHAPEIVVTRPQKMGELVSGKFKIEGYVTDGNSIKRLEYSMDDSAIRHYEPVKLKEEKLKKRRDDGVSSIYHFSLTIDTRKFKDGATTCWFKATDGAGTTKEEAFLFLIDNTKPDVKIITPASDEVKNGVFTVAGYAKDVIGIETLQWQWGAEKGNFELTPGNPYWVKEVDSRGKNKSERFTITATDTIGNTVVVSRDILLNQEDDKPKVTIYAPGNNTNVAGEEGNLFIRGFASDDDGVVSVTYKLDNQEEKTIDCAGTFYDAIPVALSNGEHTLTVYATDKYGVKGNKVTNTFRSTGIAPTFSTPSYKAGKDSVDCVNGMLINPEADGTYELKVSSSTGLKSVVYELTWGTNGKKSGSVNIQGGEKSAEIKVPLYGDDFPWGVVKISATATDVFDRVSTNTSILNIRDLTKITAPKAGVYFTDSDVNADGRVEVNENRPLTGYFAGGKIASVSVVPAVRGVTATSEDNSITVKATGASEKFKIRVTAANGAVYDSQELSFFVNAEPPKITIDANGFDTAKELPFEFRTASDVLKISGKVTASSAVEVSYRIHSIRAEIPEDLGVITAVKNPATSKEQKLTLDRRSNFTIPNMEIDSFSSGISIVEIIAVDAAGKIATEAVYVRKIPLDPGVVKAKDTGKDVTKIEPKVFWIQGRKDFYGVCVYQGTTDRQFSLVRGDSISATTSKLTFTVTPTDVKTKSKAPSYSAEVPVHAQSEVKAWFTKVDGVPYKSGMPILMDRNTTKEAGHIATVAITTNSKIKQVDYVIKGESLAGGKSSQTGAAILRTIKEGEQYEADIPLENLPARITDIKATVFDINNSVTDVQGSVAIVRSHSVVDNDEKIYWAPLGTTRFDADQNAYILNDGQMVTAFANVLRGELKVEVRGASTRGLVAEYSGKNNIINLRAESDGVFKGVSIRVTDEKGVSYNSPEINLIVDTAKPAIELSSPKDMAFVRNSLVVSGTVSDGNGITSLEYSMNDEVAAEYDKKGNVTKEGVAIDWKPLSYTRAGAFSITIPLDEFADGYVPLSLRAKDGTGKVNVLNTVVQKDNTAPEVSVILPDAEMVINGENTIVFNIKEPGLLKEIGYISSNGRISQKYEIYKNGLPEELSADENNKTLKSLNSSLANARVGTVEMPISQKMTYTFADVAGNITTLNTWDFIVDEEKDKPRAEIHLPKYQKADAENGIEEQIQVITTDFKISGVLFDDDGPCKVYYKIDNNEYKVVDAENLGFNYEISVPLASMTDNEHTVTVYAEDINGVKGYEEKAKFRISLEEPKGGVTEPEISKTVKETVTLKGWASDKNGISRVTVSIDNGATFNDAVGTTDWSYTFDTRVIQDGTHVVFIKIYDGYQITGLYSSLINVDNTAPDLRLELPLDDSKTTKNIFFSGQTTDNIGLTSLYITIRSLENRTIPDRLARRELEPAEIISQVLDISELNSGFYNIELTGTDAAGNITRVSRNIQLDKNKPLTHAELLYPLNGEHLNGEFNIYGIASSEKEDPVDKVELYIDGKNADYIEPVKVSSSGYFSFRIKKDMGLPKVVEAEVAEGAEPVTVVHIAEGLHTYKVRATTQSGKVVTSAEQTFIYSPYGPWVTLDNFAYGNFAMNRPLLKGKAGYNLTQAEKDELKNVKKLSTERRLELEGKKIRQVYISFDNGKTYEKVSKKDKSNWQYRVENLDIPAGYHFMLIKAEMYNGENAVTRTIVQVDRTEPFIKLISPGEGGHYNQVLQFDGLSSDDVELKNVRLTLRKGDKATYELPGFIQGLYFDVSVWGATLYNLGVGLTAFDNAVKVQFNYGQFTQSQRDFVSDTLHQERTDLRFGGTVFGGKIIAQLAYLPFRYFFGRDWDWLSATLSVGANFSYFTDSGAKDESGNKVAQVLSAALMQIEFPRITFSNLNYFKTWALYTEPQVWFIPSDIASDDAKKYVFTLSLGIRTSVF